MASQTIYSGKFPGINKGRGKGLVEAAKRRLQKGKKPGGIGLLPNEDRERLS